MNVENPIDWPLVCQRDFLNLFCGDQIGEGQGRRVYEYRPDPQRLVIKVETSAGSFQNIVEWEMWNLLSNRNSKWAKWFAPCVQIGSCGTVLIQRRTQTSDRPAPRKVPEIFNDMKPENFGWLDRQFVCHDYGFNLFGHHAMHKVRLIAPRWWDDDRAW